MVIKMSHLENLGHYIAVYTECNYTFRVSSGSFAVSDCDFFRFVFGKIAATEMVQHLIELYTVTATVASIIAIWVTQNSTTVKPVVRDHLSCKTTIWMHQ